MMRETELRVETVDVMDFMKRESGRNTWVTYGSIRGRLLANGYPDTTELDNALRHELDCLGMEGAISCMDLPLSEGRSIRFYRNW